MKLFSAETYIARRAQLRSLVGSGQILLLGNEESSSNFKHNHYPFRQDSSFLYFFGLDCPGLVGLIDVDEGSEILFGDDASLDDIVWTGPQEEMADLASQVGVTEVRASSAVATALGSGEVHYLPPYRPENSLKISSWLGITNEEVGAKASSRLVKAIVELRAVKSQEELAELQQALEVTASIHLAAMRTARRGVKEYEVLAAMQHAATLENSAFSFPPIVTTNGQTLHNYYYGHTLEEGLFLCDSGGESPMHYAGDMTRTYPVAPQFTTKQREIYQIVVQALQESATKAQGGKAFLEVHLHAAVVIAEGLKQLGLMKGECTEAVSMGAHALFFPHGLGHMMGLDVHDMEDLGEDLVGYNETYHRSKQFGLKSLRLGRKLEDGFVFTIEPGIYFIPELIQQWRSEKKFDDFLNYPKIQEYVDFGGIRLENDYYLQEGVAKLLGPDVPLTIAEVEDFRKSLD